MTLGITAIIIAIIALTISLFSLRQSLQRLTAIFVEPVGGFSASTKAEVPNAEALLMLERAYKDGIREVRVDETRTERTTEYQAPAV